MIGELLLFIVLSIVLLAISGVLFKVGYNIIKNGEIWWKKLLGVALILTTLTGLVGYFLKLFGI